MEELEGSPRRESTSAGDEEQGTTDVQETTDIFKDYDLYLAAKNGDLGGLSSILDRISTTDSMFFCEILSRVSPIGNTLIHVAAARGNDGIVSYIAAKDMPLVLRKNLYGDTALHLAVREGNESMVKTLVLIHRNLLDMDNPQSQVGTQDEKNLLRAKNEKGNTALHEAVINGREFIVEYLIKQDPELLYSRNKRGDYVLYLSAESGYKNCVSLILKYSTDYQRLNNLFKEKSPVEVAIMNKHRDVLEVMLNSSPHFIKLQDCKGRKSLHYAASLGYLEVVNILLKRHASIATQRDDEGSFPIHLAAVEGHVDTINLLLNYCQADPEELVDKDYRNILHLAAMKGKCNVVSYILHNPGLTKLLNMRDIKGNTPLHLASKNWSPEIVSALTWDKRVDVKLINDDERTALDVVNFYMSSHPTFRQRLTWSALKAAGTPQRQGETGQRSSVERYRERVNTLLLVSTLVATITFAAGFTLPGGYDTSDRNLGMAAMLKNKAFHIFVLTDTLAMYCSIVGAVALIWAQLADLRVVLNALNIALPLLGIALTMMSVAFTAGIFLVVRNLHWLSSVILAMGMAFLAVLLVFLIPLCMPLTSGNKILRYVSYYPFRVLVFATRTELPEGQWTRKR